MMTGAVDTESVRSGDFVASAAGDVVSISVRT